MVDAGSSCTSFAFLSRHSLPEIARNYNDAFELLKSTYTILLVSFSTVHGVLALVE